MEKVLELERQGYRYVLDADISGFFDNLCHQAVMEELSEVVADGNILRLVEKFLRAGVMEGLPLSFPPLFFPLFFFFLHIFSTLCQILASYEC